MGVALSCGRFPMSEQLADDRHGLRHGRRAAGVCVPEIVHPELRQAGLVPDAVPEPVEPNGLSVLDVIEDPVDPLAGHRAAIEAEILESASDAAKGGFRKLIDAATDTDELLKARRKAERRHNSIRVSDTGSGMSADDLTKVFLVIGTGSCKEAVEAARKELAAFPLCASAIT